MCREAIFRVFRGKEDAELISALPDLHKRASESAINVIIRAKMAPVNGLFIHLSSAT